MSCEHGVPDDRFCMSCCREGEGKGLTEEEKQKAREEQLEIDRDIRENGSYGDWSD